MCPLDCRAARAQLDARNALGRLLLDRCDEACLLAERAHAQEAVLRQGAPAAVRYHGAWLPAT